MWYAENMSRKKRDNRKKVKQKRAKKLTPLGIFLRTFFGVLGVGLCGILIYSYVFRSGSRPQGSGELGGVREEESREGLASFWEIIPQKEDVREAMQHISQETDTDTGIYADVLADPEYMAANNIYSVANKTDGIVTVGFAGDILFDDEYAMMANLKKRGAAIENAISQPLLSCMRDMDIMMLNNEFPYTDRGTATEGKTFTFRADTSTVSYLSDMGVDVVSLANNHSYDFGEVGLRENPDTKGATESSPGVFRCLNPQRLCEMVSQAKQNSDFVVVFIHWGTENVTQPDWAQLDQAPKLAEAGADLIIGAHPHCLQGIQYYGEVPVVYSLGNFWFNSKTLDTGIIQADISREGIQNLRFIPAIQSDCRTDLACDGEKERILSYLQSISYGVTIDSQGNISQGNISP